MRPRTVFLIFLALNVLNYLDRYVTSGILPLLKIHFHATDVALGALGSAFMITYALIALPVGAWSDRWYPHKVAALGALIWSIATLFSAFAWSLTALFVLRALVGVGEAAYVTTGGTILSGLYPQKRRALVLSTFNLGMPIGAALGVTLGGFIGAHFGWQAAFLLVGVPGLILAHFTWRLPLSRFRDGSSPQHPMESSSPQHPMEPASVQPRMVFSDVLQLLRNVPYLMIVLGYAALSYAYGAFAWFAPTFLHRYFGYTIGKAGLVMGAITVAAGLLAPIGGVIADRWYRHHSKGRVYTLFIAMFLSAWLLLAGVLGHNLVALFFSSFFMLWQGIASSLVFDVTKKHMWNTATALSLLLMHLLGDIPGTFIVGYISDRTSLLTSLSILPIPMLLASFLFLASGRFRSVQ